MAASAMSHSTPPWSVPIGLACRGPASNATTARPGSTSVRVKPIRSAIGGGAASPRCTIRMKSSAFGIGAPPE